MVKTPKPRSALVGLLVAAIAVASVVVVSPASALGPYEQELLVRATDANGGQLAGGAGSVKVSGDGRWMAFSRLDGSGVFVKDLLTGGVQRVSLSDTEAVANQPATVVGISRRGDTVAFETTATNMGEGAATTDDLYVRKLGTGRTYRMNLLPTALPGALKPGESALSGNGNTVAFTVGNHLFVRTMFAGNAQQVDVSKINGQSNGGSKDPALDFDGGKVLFTSSSSDIVASDTNFVSDVFQRNVAAGTTVRVSLGDAGQANLGSFDPTSNVDGTEIAFSSDADNLVGGDTNHSTDVFYRNIPGDSTTRVSIDVQSHQVFGDSGHPSISADGRFIDFDSKAEDLDVSVPNAGVDVFRRDFDQGYTAELGFNVDHRTANKGGAYLPSISDDGRSTAFVSAGDNLVAGDTNKAPDAFVDRIEQLGPHGVLYDLARQGIKDFGQPMSTLDARDADLDNGRVSPTHLIVTFAHTPAWSLNRAPIARLYQAFFHRVPDLGGFNFWVAKRAAGSTLGSVASNFVGSPEFKATYGNVVGSQFVALVYGNVLQRKPDQAGLDYWTNRLATGLTRGDLMVQFSESPEGRQVLSPQVDSTLIGLAMLHTMPSASLWKAAADHAFKEAVPEAGALVYLLSADYASLIEP